MGSSIVGDIDLTSEPLLGARFAENDKRLQALEAGSGKTPASGALDCSPTGVASYRREKKFVFPNISYSLSGDIRKIKTIIVQRSLITTQAAFDSLRIVDTEKDISDVARAAGLADLEFSAGKAGLDYGTTFDILKVIWNGGEGQTPAAEIEPDFATYFANPAGTALLSFTTPEQFNVPSAPATGLIAHNERDAQTADEADAHAGLKVHAPLTDAGAAQSFGAAVVEWVQATIQRDFGGAVGVKNIPFKRLLTDPELAQVDVTSTPANRGFVIIEANGLKAGAAYTWIENKIKTLEGKKTTTGSVTFSAGGESGDLTTLTSVSLTVSASAPYDGKHVKVSLNFTQPAAVVTLKNFTLKRKLSTDVSYTDVVIERGMEVQADINMVAGAHTVIVDPSLKVKPSLTYNLELTLRTRTNTTTRVVTATFTTDADGNIVQDTAAPGSLNTPKLWFKRGKLMQKMSMSGLTNINSLSTIEATITDGSFSLNLDDLDSDTKASGVVYYHQGRDDCVLNTGISLKQLKRIFGDVQLKGAFRLTNSVGQTTSPFSALLPSLSSQSDYSPNSGGGNELWNGDFTNDNEASATVLAHWEQYRISNGNFLVIDTGTTRGRWNRDSHLVFWRQNDSSTNKVYIYEALFQTLVFGDFHAFSFFLSSDSSLSANFDLFIGAIIEPLTGTWSINGTATVSGSSGAALTELRAGAEVAINNEVRTVLNIANDNSFTVTVAFSGTAGPLSCHAVVPVSDVVALGAQTYTTTETYVEAVVQIDPAAAANFSGRDLYLLLRTSTTISTSGPYLQVGRVMMVPGKTPVQFDRKHLKERNSSSTGLTAGAPIAAEDLSFVPITGIGGDRQDPSGAFGDIPTQGGFILG